MLRGFTPWQKRITLLGVLGALGSLLGAIGPWPLVVVSGMSLAICCLFGLVLVSSRQNSRELKKLQTKNRPSKTQPNISIREKSLPAVGSDSEYARRVKRNVPGYEAFALRSRSLLIRDSFALAATNGDYDCRTLIDFVTIQRLNMLPSVKRADLGDWDPQSFLALARILANQRTREDDLEHAVRMFSFAEAFFGKKSLKQADKLINLEALGELHRYDQQTALARRFNLEKTHPVQATLMKLNELLAQGNADSAAWIQFLNDLYRKYGYSPVEVMENKRGAALDSLRTMTAITYTGPLVSIIIPTFEGGNQLLNALKSLLEQSWRDLEVIVVDDGSGTEYESYLKQAAELDPRVKVIKHEKNWGAYRARNTGLQVAQGDYITIHDDDDWSHGDKIATQVQHLLDNPGIIGNMTTHVRTTDQLKFLRINNNPTFSQANYSSLMIPKTVLETIGPWDEVNRGGDAEFRDRILAHYGKKIEVLREVPLSFTRTWEGSLTSGEINRGYLDSSRRLYATAYKQWHDHAGNDAALLRPTRPRRFPIPTTMEPGKRNQDLGTFDIVFMTDFRFPGGTTALTLREIEACKEAGYRVGYIQSESPLNGTTPPVSERLFELQLSNRVEQVSLQDSAHIKLLLIRHPSVVTFLDQATTKLHVEKTVMVVNNPPVLVGGGGMVFDLNNSIENLDSLFNGRTILVPESGVTRALCVGLVSEKRIYKRNWPGLVDLQKGQLPDFDRRPKLGRHSRDHELKWPSSVKDYDAVYSSDFYDTMFLGGASALTKKLGTQTIADKDVLDFGAMEVEDFLRNLDFWAYYHDDQLTESFGMAIAEALASGKVVFLPPYLETSFGEGALYAEPSEVEDLIKYLWNNPDEYLQQSQRAQRFVEENFSKQAFIGRIRELLNR